MRKAVPAKVIKDEDSFGGTFVDKPPALSFELAVKTAGRYKLQIHIRKNKMASNLSCATSLSSISSSRPSLIFTCAS